MATKSVSAEEMPGESCDFLVLLKGSSEPFMPKVRQGLNIASGFFNKKVHGVDKESKV